MALDTFSESVPFNPAFVFTNANSPGLQVVVHGPTVPYRLDSILVSNNDAISHTLSWLYQSGGVSYFIGQTVIPAGTGIGAAPPVDALALLLPATVAGLRFAANDNLVANCVVAVGAGNQVTLLGQGGSF